MHCRTFLFIVVMCSAANAFAVGTLQLGEATVEDQQVVIPVILGGNVGSGVSAMDFRIHYDPAVLEPVSAEAGPAAMGADKNVMANVRSPGEYVVVMMGMNQTTCRSGEVVNIVMQRIGESQDTGWNVELVQPTLSSLEGSSIETRVIPSEDLVPDETPERKEDAEEEKKPEDTPDDASPVMPVRSGQSHGVENTPAGGTTTRRIAPPAGTGGGAPIPEPRLDKRALETNRMRLATAAAASEGIREAIQTPLAPKNEVHSARKVIQNRGIPRTERKETPLVQKTAEPRENVSDQTPRNTQYAHVISGENRRESDTARVVGEALKSPEKLGDPRPIRSHRTGLTLGAICVTLLCGISLYAFRRRFLN